MSAASKALVRDTDYSGLEVQMVKSFGVYGDYIARKRMNSRLPDGAILSLTLLMPS